MAKNRITVTSGNGELAVDGDTGNVIVGESVYANEELKGINKMDLDEYRRAYPDDNPNPGQIDILDLGYWHGPKNEYEPPATDWRADIAEDLFGRKAVTNRHANIRATEKKINKRKKSTVSSQIGGLR